ncbi:MAG: CoA transferase [SAR324 cluster bacterium]|nr:CoA transferase [SAR324 cluster bacterium]
MGPLAGIKIVEIGSIGPGPFCAQMLADMGADIIRIDRKAPAAIPQETQYEVLHRNRRSVMVDLKKPAGVQTVLKLIAQADALIEGFRPGVMERLGLGPDICFELNSKLVYGRMTGWGQDGPLSQAAGHDINYISLSGALHAIGQAGEKPAIPLNLIGDFGGGGMLLAFGIMCGIYEAGISGRGQVVDASMVEGSAALSGMFYGMVAGGIQNHNRGTNLLDGGAHFYNTYETADGKWISVGSIEPQFYALLLKHTGIEDPEFKSQMDMERWPDWKMKMADIFKAKSRDEWCAIMEGTDVCFAPVLSFEEVNEHPHNKARHSFIEVEGVLQPAPAPRFSRTPPEMRYPPPKRGEHNESALKDWGFQAEEIAALKSAEVI